MSFRDKRTLFERIDSLPTGPEFRCVEVTIDGDQCDEEGRTSETLELWMRDPLECVKELMGNPAFADEMTYAPVREWNGSSRVYSEAWTGDWWWDTQVHTMVLYIELFLLLTGLL